VRITIQYFAGTSPMHRMDAATKFFWVLVVGAAAFLVSSPVLVVGILVALVLVWAILVRVSVARAVRSALWIVILAGGTAFFQLIAQRNGTPIFSLGPLPITDVGIRGGLLYGSRIMALAFSSLAFVWTTDPRDMVVALVAARVPYRFAYTIFVVLRMLPVLENEAVLIREAQAVRGVAQLQGRFQRLQRYALPLLVAGVRRAEAMAVAMDCRAFGAFAQRTFIDDFHWSPRGVVLLAVTTLAAVAVLYVNAFGNLPLSR
jgi:energy-coupling factor transport system permease protein